VRPPGFGQGGGGGRGAAAPPPPDALTFPASDISPVWGESYNELGRRPSGNRSQGTPALFGNAFFRRPTLLVSEDPNVKIDAQQFAEPIESLAARFPSYQALMAPALTSADEALAAAEKSALALDRTAAASSVAQAGKQVAALRDAVAKQDGADQAAALWEIDHVRARIDGALSEVVSMSIAVNADRTNSWPERTSASI